MQYKAGEDLAKRYKNAPGAINEGYVDIFGCIIEYNWKMAEALFDEPGKCFRNIAIPDALDARRQGPNKMSSSLYMDYASFPANLMLWGFLQIMAVFIPILL